MKPTLQIRLGQSLTLTPQLRLAIRLLQLSAVELELEINDAVDSNPLLEREEDEADVPAFEPGQAAADAPDDAPPDLVGSSRVDLQACKLEYSIVSPK